MKKFVRILAALLALLLLAGCGAEPEEVGGQLTPADDSTTPVEATEVSDPEKKAALGRLEGGVYTNGYTGYGCTLDENWTFYSAEELQELPENVAELMEGSELAETGDFLGQITDMMAENANDLTTINVLYQKLSMQDRLVYMALNEEQIIDATLGQMDAMVDAYAQAGIMVDTMEKTTVTFLGEERTALLTSATIEGIPYYTLQLFDYHLGQYSVTLTLASYVENNTAQLLELFYAVD